LHIALDTHPLLDTLVETRRTFVTPAITLTPGLSTIGFEGQEVHSMDDASAPPAVLWFSPFRWMGDGEMVGESGWTDVDVVFADTLRLLAYRLPTSSLQPGEDLWLELRWEMMRSVPENYKLFVHIIDMNGELLAQRDSEPLDARYHTSWLGAGEMVWDSFSISLPPGIPPGTYAVKAGWYDASSGERLSVDALQTTDASTAFILGTIELPSNR
jgi:hypothetical protein